jgi:hypothetical protein
MFLPELSIKRPVLATVMSLLIILIGVISFLRLTVREYPKIDTPVVSVRTVYKGASPQVMESQVTQPLEDSISGIEGVKSIKSVSREEVSQITVEFVLERATDAAANDVRDRVSRVRGQLPDEVDEPIIAKVEADAQAILWLRLYSDRHPALEISDYADRFVVDRLKTLSGVASVIIGGERRYAMRIWLDRERLAAYGLTPQDVEDALRRQNVEVPSGRIESVQREFTVLSESDLRTPEEFNRIIVREVNGYAVRLRDVGRAELGPQDERNRLRVNGRQAVGMGVVKQSTANTLSVARAVKAELPRLQAALPPGMNLDVAFDTSVFIEKSIESVYEVMAEALLLVVLVIFFFLRSLRATLIPFVTIPVSLIGAFFLVWMMGFTINVLTLLGIVLAIGLVVDDAIVVLENIHRHIEEGMSPLNAAITGSREIAFAVVAMTVTLAAVFAPLAFSTGNTGRLFMEFALTVASAVVVSGFVALTLTPMMCSKLLRHHSAHGRVYNTLEGWFASMSSGYRRTLAACLRRRLVVIGVFAAVAAIGGAVFATLKSELSPLEDRGFFLGLMVAPEGATMDYTDGYARIWESIYKDVPEILTYFVSVAPGLDRPNPVNFAISFMRLKDWSERDRKTQEITAALQPKMVATMPGVIASLINPPSLGQSFRNPPVQFVVQGNSYEQLDRVVNELRLHRQRSQAQQAPAQGGYRSRQGLGRGYPGRADRAHAGDAPGRAAGHPLQARGQAVRRHRPARGQGPPQAHRPHLDLRARDERAARAAREPGYGHRDRRAEGAQPLQPASGGDHLRQPEPGLHAIGGARLHGPGGERGADRRIQDRPRRPVAGVPRVGPAALFRILPGARLHLPGTVGAVRELPRPARHHADRAARHGGGARRNEARRRDAQRLQPDRAGHADRPHHQERHPDRRVHQPAARPRHGQDRGADRGVRAAPAPDPDDEPGDRARLVAARHRHRRGIGVALGDRLGGGGRHVARDALHALRDSRRLHLHRRRASPHRHRRGGLAAGRRAGAEASLKSFTTETRRILERNYPASIGS